MVLIVDRARAGPLSGSSQSWQLVDPGRAGLLIIDPASAGLFNSGSNQYVMVSLVDPVSAGLFIQPPPALVPLVDPTRAVARVTACPISGFSHS